MPLYHNRVNAARISQMCYTHLMEIRSNWVLPLISWYQENKRPLPWRETSDPYAIWISEIMLQQTRVAAVIPYYTRFLSELPNAFALASVDDDRLKKLWEGLGYYSRARCLKRAAEIVVNKYGGNLPNTYDALLSLPGIGAYTAGAIASIAFSIPVPAVDGNVLRVYARLYADARDMRDPRAKSDVRTFLLPLVPLKAPGAFNAALMELGACVCLPNGAPKCGSCPVSAFCKALTEGRETELPVKKAKRPRKTEEKTVFALSHNGRFLGFRRPETGLLAGLWQLPDTVGTLSDAACANMLGAWGLRPVGELRFFNRAHIFTHIEWHMRVCAAEVSFEALPNDWILLGEEHALPTAYRVCLPK